MCMCTHACALHRHSSSEKNSYSVWRHLNANLHSLDVQTAKIMLRSFPQKKTWLGESKLSSQSLFTKELSHIISQPEINITEQGRGSHTSAVWFSSPLVFGYAAGKQHLTELVFLDNVCSL